MRVLVVGAGLSGLSCASTLVDAGAKVTLVEIRAEIGHPQDRPGLVLNPQSFGDHSEHIQLTSNGCRRPWLAKSMAQRLAAAGVEIHLKTRAPDHSDGHDQIIDTRRAPAAQQWQGGVTLSGREPVADLIAHRGDGTVECWFQGPIPEVKGGWLERFSGAFFENEASVDSSIDRGITLASQQKA